jgi:hypothetical protein
VDESELALISPSVKEDVLVDALVLVDVDALVLALPPLGFLG